MTYNIQNTATAALAAIFSAVVFVGASIGPAFNNASSVMI